MFIFTKVLKRIVFGPLRNSTCSDVNNNGAGCQYRHVRKCRGEYRMISRIVTLSPLALQIICNSVFAQDVCKPKDCVDLKCYGVSRAEDGPHTIYPDGQGDTPMNVSCDQTSFDGGWIVLQRRAEGGTVNFTRSWADYKDGFGDHGDETTELWLGNENVRLLLSGCGRHCLLYMHASSDTGAMCTAKFERFSLDDETNDYAMHFDGLETVGGAGSCTPVAFIYLDKQPFRTNDHMGNAGKCFKTYSAGWWYYKNNANKCLQVFLNGPHIPAGVTTTQNVTTKNTIYIESFNRGLPLRDSSMVFRPGDATTRGCGNPCTTGPKTVCAYESANDTHSCVCPPLLCGPSCSGPCTNGGQCVDDVCECAAGFEGPLCSDAITVAAETKPFPAALVGVLVVALLLILAGLFYVIRTVKKKRREEAMMESRQMIDAAIAARLQAEEEGGLFSWFSGFGS